MATATTTLPVNVKQALGSALVEVLTGNLTDETIQAVSSIHRDEIPTNLVDIFHAIQGMSLSQTVRESASLNVLGELSAAAEDAFKQRFNS